MYRKIGSTNQNQQQIVPDKQVEEEKKLQEKTAQLGPQIGNEAVLQLLSGDDGGNNGGAGKGTSLLVDALTDPKRSNGEIKDIVLPKKAEARNQALPQASEPPKQKQLLYKDPDDPKQRDKSYIDAPENTLPPDDMAVEMDASDLQNVSYVENSPKTLDEDDMLIPPDPKKKKIKHSLDHEEINADMYPVKGWNFTPQKMEDVKTTSGFAKFKNKLAHIFGGVFNFLSSAFGIKQSIAAIRRYAAGKKKEKLNADVRTKIQDKRDHSAIPGWEGAKFDPNANSGEDILADFRRVPTVWSKLTADKASEGEDENEKPLPPTITIYVDQPKDNSSQSMAFTEMGHTMIGIEYSRFSQISKRYERYKLQYGFYPVSLGTFSDKMAKGVNDIIVPGKMMDDAGHTYTVSRRYPATAKQVNAILQASETYADGGYGCYARNCTTFVKDMAEIAHLPVSDKLFEKDEVGFSDIANAGRVAAGIPGDNNLASVEEKLVDFSQKEDESYANFGNKRITEQDFQNYNQSLKNGPAEKKETYIPASVGEHLRRETTGEIGSYNYTGNIQPFKDASSITAEDIQTIREEINQHTEDLRKIILYQVLKGVKDPTKELPPELKKLIIGLSKYGDSLSPLEKEHDGGKKPPLKKIQTARQKLSANISDLNNLYFRYFKGDKRLHEPVMKLISLLNVGITTLDDEYSRSFEERAPDEDLGSLPQMMNQPQKIQAGGKEEELSPSFYEAYLQIYKTPDKAVPAAHRYEELKRMDDNGYKWSLHPIDKKEWEKAKRIYGLAMEFVKSHRYMLEKNTYNQQDVDYAFMQLDRENDKKASGRLLQASSGKIYLALILKKIFGGVSQRFKTYINQDEQNKQEGNLIKWLDEDMSNALSNNKDKMLTLVRGQKKSQEKKNGMEVNVDSLSRDIQDTIYSNWISVVFDEEKKDIDEDLQEQMKNIFHHITSDGSSAKKFQNLLKALVKQVMTEDQIAQDDLVKLWNKKKS